MQNLLGLGFFGGHLAIIPVIILYYAIYGSIQ